MTEESNPSRIEQETEPYPIDDSFYWLMNKISEIRSNPDRESFIGTKRVTEIRRKLRELYDRGYEAGREDEQTVSKKGGM